MPGLTFEAVILFVCHLALSGASPGGDAAVPTTGPDSRPFVGLPAEGCARSEPFSAQSRELILVYDSSLAPHSSSSSS